AVAGPAPAIPEGAAAGRQACHQQHGGSPPSFYAHTPRLPSFPRHAPRPPVGASTIGCGLIAGGRVRVKGSAATDGAPPAAWQTAPPQARGKVAISAQSGS